MNAIKIPLVIGIINGLCQINTKEPLAHHHSSTVAIVEAPHLDAGGYGGRFGDLVWVDCGGFVTNEEYCGLSEGLVSDRSSVVWAGRSAAGLDDELSAR